jgi:hypothetical protein
VGADVQTAQRLAAHTRILHEACLPDRDFAPVAICPLLRVSEPSANERMGDDAVEQQFWIIRAQRRALDRLPS